MIPAIKQTNPFGKVRVRILLNEFSEKHSMYQFADIRLNLSNNYIQMDLSALLPESYISNLEISKEHLNCDTAISLLRLSHSGEVSAEEIGCTREEVVQGSWNLIEMDGTDKQRIWLRYYCSIGASIWVKSASLSKLYVL